MTTRVAFGHETILQNVCFLVLMRAGTRGIWRRGCHTLRQLLATAQVENTEGETIVREGDAAQTFFIIEAGECIAASRPQRE